MTSILDNWIFWVIGLTTSVLLTYKIEPILTTFLGKRGKSPEEQAKADEEIKG